MTDLEFFAERDDLNVTWQHLIRESEKALASAYAPYSSFRVATSLLMEDNTVVTGSNQENAAYPSGMCAERVALFTAASLHPGKKIVKLLIIAMREDRPGTLLPATPCGGCRQVMAEMEIRQQSPIQILMLWKPGQWVKVSSALSLLPFSFQPDNLK
ncbi:MAG TPA: cytidine deaminase [Ohtaekwangia sp.]|nr:cytidine deaminase [Ohtaekwangia sp.]